MAMFHSSSPQIGARPSLRSRISTAKGLVCGIALILIAGCGGPDAPEEIFQRWLNSLEKGDLEAAFDTLSGSNQERLAEAEELWIARSAEGYVQTLADPLVPDDDPAPQHQRKGLEPGFLLFRRLVAGPGFGQIPPLPPEASQRMKTVKIEGERALITVDTPLGESQATLVRTDTGWRIDLDLPPALP